MASYLLFYTKVILQQTFRHQQVNFLFLSWQSDDSEIDKLCLQLLYSACLTMLLDLGKATSVAVYKELSSFHMN